MEYTMENFKNGEFVINCQSENEAEKLMEMSVLEDIRWSGSQIATAQTYWDIHKEKTCYEASKYGLLYGHYNEFKKSPPIIEFNNLKHSQKSNREKVLEMIGVEIDEPFNISGYSFNPYIFDDKYNLIDKDGDKRPGLIFDIIWDDLKIEKIPKDPNAEIKKYIELLSSEKHLDDNVQNGVLVSLKELLTIKESKSA